MDPLAAAGTILHPLKAPEDVGAVRRLVHALALQMGASAADCGRAELAVTELGTNTLHHARPGGYLLVQRLAPPHGRGLEILAVDRGPGIRQLGSVLQGTARATDVAVSPMSGLGCGLSSVSRIASDFDVHTSEQGTVVLARFCFEPPLRSPHFRWGAVSVPLLGEQENGDGWACVADEFGCGVLVADGLGHGPAAARASGAAVEMFQRAGALDIERYFDDAHLALRGTRGAAVSVCKVVLADETLLFAGLGNVEGRCHGKEASTGFTPRSGTVGMNVQPSKIQVRRLAWEPGCILVMHSDGVRQHFDLGTLRDLRQRDPTLVAAVLHRDHGRGRDDATVVVLQDTRVGGR